MLNVSEAVKEAYINGNANTSIFLTINGTEYDPRNILSGSVSVTESLCSGSQFDLSSVEKNELAFTLFNITENIKDLQGKTVVARQEVTVADGGTTTTVSIPLGVFTIVEAVNDGDYLFKCTAYDSATLAFDTNIDAWWNSTVTFPITLRNLAISLFTYLGVSYVIPATFTNSDYSIATRTTYFEGVTAAELLGYIQEVAGGFFKADREGVIRFSSISYMQGLVPYVGLYPKEGLYPDSGTAFIGDEDVARQDYSYRQIVSDLVIADYKIDKVDKLQVRGTEDDVGIIVGTGDNAYIIQGNPLLYNLTDTTGNAIVTAIYNAIKSLTYIPFSGKLMSLPFVEVGDAVCIISLKNKTAKSPLFHRVLNGARLSFDTFTCNGSQEREEVSQVNRTLKILNNKTHELVNTVEELTSTITEIEDEVTTHTTQISQNAENIALKVSTSDYTGANIVNLINLDDSGAKILANHVIIDTSSLDLTFGSEQSNVTIQATTADDGVLFDGTGKVQFETNGEFKAENLDSNDEVANRIRLAAELTDTSLSTTYNFAAIGNLYDGNEKNRHTMYAYSDRTYQWITNNRPDAQINANNHYMGATPSENVNRLYNYEFNNSSSLLRANNLILQSTSSSNYVSLENASDDGYRKNRLYFYANKDSSAPNNYTQIDNYHPTLYESGSSKSSVPANSILQNAYSKTHTMAFWNYAARTPDSTSAYTANYMHFSSNYTDAGYFNDNISIINYKYEDHYAANMLNMTSYLSDSSTGAVTNSVQFQNNHANHNLGNWFILSSVNNSSYMALVNYNSSGVERSALRMNSDGTIVLKTTVNNAQYNAISMSNSGNLDLITGANLHLNVSGDITVQNTSGSGYFTGAGSGGSPTGTDNVAVKNWDYSSSNDSVINLHFYKGLYIGWSKA